MNNASISPWRAWCIRAGKWIEAPRQQAFIVAAILFNSLTLGLSTVPALHERYGEMLNLVDHIIIGIFVVEIVLKLLHTGIPSLERVMMSLLD